MELPLQFYQSIGPIGLIIIMGVLKLVNIRLGPYSPQLKTISINSRSELKTQLHRASVMGLRRTERHRFEPCSTK